MKPFKKPFLVERFADNGALSHYELINEKGDVLWSGGNDESKHSSQVMSQKEKRIAMIAEFATKVLQYPKGSRGFDPIDEFRLRDNIEKYLIEHATADAKEGLIVKTNTMKLKPQKSSFIKNIKAITSLILVAALFFTFCTLAAISGTDKEFLTELSRLVLAFLPIIGWALGGLVLLIIIVILLVWGFD